MPCICKEFNWILSQVLETLYQNVHTNSWNKYLVLKIRSIHHPSTLLQPLLGPWPLSEDSSILLCLLLVSSILVFLGSVMCHSGRCPPIMFLLFALTLYYEFAIKSDFWDPFIFHSYNITDPSHKTQYNIWEVPIEIADGSEGRQASTLWIQLAVYTATKRRGYKSVHLAPPSAEIKNV